MHPLLGHPRRLLLYALAWGVPTAALALSLHLLTGYGGGAAVALALPLAAGLAGALLPVWYSCRVQPLSAERGVAVLLTHLAAALLVGGAWAGLAQLLLAAAAAAGWRLPPRPGTAVLVAAAGALLYLLTVAAFYLTLAAQASSSAATRALAAEALARESELRALRAQLDPHFLFNCLNSISALTGRDPARAREMCVLLGDFLRQTLKLGSLGEGSTVPLAEELALARQYLAIEAVRFGPRLELAETIAPEALGVPVPPLLLQPLLENAIKHGVAQSTTPVAVRLSAHCPPGELHLSLANGFDPDALHPPGNGLGLANVRGRLLTGYHGRARIEAGPAPTGEFLVAITLPAAAAATAAQEAS